jgi:hypothetical protein
VGADRPQDARNELRLDVGQVSGEVVADGHDNQEEKHDAEQEQQ